ncbi:uncharacterized protein LOC129798980 isoform X1 [Phlebotomus papatasi]|uniref:uncharacterized protein LOC129798980 isoform X1 n=1 Tax=Phlebotomus papatasi TaxID=29031 RepID=UPI0024833F83|nr:uncharacterized protein LOC129798980 isoform X1 [Phlebotomus papatasi]
MIRKWIILAVCVTILVSSVSGRLFNFRRARARARLSNRLIDPAFEGKCPLCDSSVYGYCSDRLFHDACCCDRPTFTGGLGLGGGQGIFGASCYYADCSFLYANSCYEHDLITNCCCNQ